MSKDLLISTLKEEGFSECILEAFRNVSREEFVPEEYRGQAYDDVALPLCDGATISQPYTIAFMLELLDLGNDMRILEIGSGSGYVLALMNEICKKSEIYGIEKNGILVEYSSSLLNKYANIKIVNGDGKKGLESHAPYDRILISGEFLEIPHHLLDQLTSEGVIVVPVKGSIRKLERIDGIVKETEYPGFLFVPIE